VKPCKILEAGNFRTYFAFSNTETFFFGGLHCIVADDVGARRNLLLRGANAKVTSRYFEKKFGYEVVLHPSFREWKDCSKHRELLNELLQLNNWVSLLSYDTNN
jgi:hypothetical protein